MVSWQNTDFYRGLKQQERETGWTVADHNRVNNPYGSHSFGGLLLSQMLPQLLMGGMAIGLNYAETGGGGGSSKTTNPEDTVESLSESIEELKSKHSVGNVTELETKQAQAETDLGVLKTNLGTINNTITVLEKNIGDLKAQQNAIGSGADANIENSAGIPEQLKELNNELIKEKAQREEKVKEINDKESEITNIKADIIKYKDYNKRLEVAKKREEKAKADKKASEISDIVKECKNAKTQAEKDILIQKLKEAVKEYSENYSEFPNRTIENVERYLNKQQVK